MIMRILILIMALLSAKISFAETPWYVGAGFGMTNYQGDSINNVPAASIDVDGWESSYSLFGGYQFNESWAVEAGYVDFGETEDFDPTGQIIGVGVNYESSGLYLNGQYHIPLNNSLSLDLVGGLPKILTHLVQVLFREVQETLKVRSIPQFQLSGVGEVTKFGRFLD